MADAAAAEGEVKVVKTSTRKVRNGEANTGERLMSVLER